MDKQNTVNHVDTAHEYVLGCMCKLRALVRETILNDSARTDALTLIAAMFTLVANFDHIEYGRRDRENGTTIVPTYDHPHEYLEAIVTRVTSMWSASSDKKQPVYDVFLTMCDVLHTYIRYK